MLDRRFVYENIEAVKSKLIERGLDAPLGSFVQMMGERKRLLQRVEEKKARRNKVSKEIGRVLHETGDRQAAEAIRTEMRELADEIRELDNALRVIEEQTNEILLSLPNLPHHSVPVGQDESHNVVVRQVGQIPRFDFEAKPHWELGKALGALDFEVAAKITGARFSVLTGLGARLERALIDFMLDLAVRERGYREVSLPFMVNRESMLGTGQLPKFEADSFRVEGTDYFLIPTAEVPLVNLYRETVLEPEQLPIRLAAYTPCFRSEAGAYGKDTRGLIRQHQFHKVELVKLTHPDVSYEELETLVADAEEVLKRLELPYRVVNLCTADLGFAAAKCYDLEVWVPSQGRYREISSCSNCEDFQARRAAIRFKEAKGKPDYVHTLNGSGVAVGRTLLAIMELFQEEDGSIRLPAALWPYMDGTKVLRPTS